MGLTSWFQFQIGAIGRFSDAKDLYRRASFQFQIGAIGSGGGGVTMTKDNGFNSRLVRLVAVRRLKKIS